jgi:hypothetical protein
MPMAKLARFTAVTGALPTMDVIMLALGLSLFAATVAYAYACERL